MNRRESLPDQATLREYARVLDVHANQRADDASLELVELLKNNGIPVDKIMVRAFHQEGHVIADFVIVLAGEDNLELERRVYEVTQELMFKDENLAMEVVVISSKSPSALDPDHYFSSHRTVFSTTP